MSSGEISAFRMEDGRRFVPESEIADAVAAERTRVLCVIHEQPEFTLAPASSAGTRNHMPVRGAISRSQLLAALEEAG